MPSPSHKALPATLIGRITILPLAIGLVYFPSLAWTVEFADGGTDFYGAPLPWNSRSLVTSLSKDVYVLPLVVDVIFYALVSHWLLRHMCRILAVSESWIVVALVWVWGTGSAVLMILVTSIDPAFHSWYTHPWIGVVRVWVSTCL